MYILEYAFNAFQNKDSNCIFQSHNHNTNALYALLRLTLFRLALEFIGTYAPR